MVCLDSAALNSGALLAFAPQPLHGRPSRAAGSYIHPDEGNPIPLAIHRLTRRTNEHDVIAGAMVT